MRIGITYDLKSDYLHQGYSEEEIAELDKEETIDSIELALQKLGYETDRIGHVHNLMQQLLEGKRWDLVFNICEGIYGDSREMLVPALLDAYQIKYVFSGAVTMGISLNKAFAKQIIHDAGINTPPFILINNIEDIKCCQLAYPLFAKPVAEGTGKGIDEDSVIYSSERLEAKCKYLLQKFKQPVLVEEYLPGREFTVGIIGNGQNATVIGAIEVIYKNGVNNIYSFSNKENYQNKVEYRKVDNEILKECSNIALKVWNVLNVFDGGRIDLRIDKSGKMSFIEINPLAGLNPIHSDLPILCYKYGIEYTQLISMIVKSAIKRNNILQDECK